MKRIVLMLLCSLFAVSVVTAQNTKNKKETVTFLVDGMDCNNCIKKIEKNISFEKGVTDLKCDLSTHTAEVTYRTDKTTEEKLVAAFKKIGMPATPLTEGMEIPAKTEKNQ